MMRYGWSVNSNHPDTADILLECPNCGVRTVEGYTIPVEMARRCMPEMEVC